MNLTRIQPNQRSTDIELLEGQFQEQVVQNEPSHLSKASDTLENQGLIDIHLNIVCRSVHLGQYPSFQLIPVLRLTSKIFLNAVERFLTLTINDPSLKFFEAKDGCGIPLCFRQSMQAAIIFYRHAVKYPSLHHVYKANFLFSLKNLISLSQQNNYRFTYDSQKHIITLYCDNKNVNTFSINIDSPPSAFLFFVFIKYCLINESFISHTEPEENIKVIVEFLEQYKDFYFISNILKSIVYQPLTNCKSLSYNSRSLVTDLKPFIYNFVFFKRLAEKNLIDPSLIEPLRLLKTTMHILEINNEEDQDDSLCLLNNMIRMGLVDLTLINRCQLVKAVFPFLSRTQPSILRSTLSLLLTLEEKGAIDQSLLSEHFLVQKFISLLSLPFKYSLCKVLSLLKALLSKELISQSQVRRFKLVQKLTLLLSHYDWQVHIRALTLLGSLAKKEFIDLSLAEDLEIIPKILSLFSYNQLGLQREAFRAIIIFAQKGLMNSFPISCQNLEDAMTPFAFHQIEFLQIVPFQLLDVLITANLLDERVKNYLIEKMTFLYFDNTLNDVLRLLALLTLSRLTNPTDLFNKVSEPADFKFCIEAIESKQTPTKSLFTEMLFAEKFDILFTLFLSHPNSEIQELAKQTVAIWRS